MITTAINFNTSTTKALSVLIRSGFGLTFFSRDSFRIIRGFFFDVSRFFEDIWGDVWFWRLIEDWFLSGIQISKYEASEMGLAFFDSHEPVRSVSKFLESLFSACFGFQIQIHGMLWSNNDPLIRSLEWALPNCLPEIGDENSGVLPNCRQLKWWSRWSTFLLSIIECWQTQSVERERWFLADTKTHRHSPRFEQLTFPVVQHFKWKISFAFLRDWRVYLRSWNHFAIFLSALSTVVNSAVRFLNSEWKYWGSHFGIFFPYSSALIEQLYKILNDSFGMFGYVMEFQLVSLLFLYLYMMEDICIHIFFWKLIHMY